MKRKSILVVGSGLSGSVVAREMAEAGFFVDVIDQRDHIAGNCYDYLDDTGIRIHKYGPHIFHTSNLDVVDWLNRFTGWIDYEHRVLAQLEGGRLVPFPPNEETLKWVNKEAIVDTFYRPYSEKMWALALEQIDETILSRVPVREGLEDRYFPKASFQKLPDAGYTAMVSNILNHERIKVHLNQSFSKDMERGYHHIFNSMPIDEYFDFCFGELPYRSIKFHRRQYSQTSVYPVPVVNFTDTGVYTRATEWKNFPNHGDVEGKTVVVFEEPCDYRDNNLERYYPVKDKSGENRARYKQYAQLPLDNMSFIGRCGLYVYIDMDQAVSTALAVCRRFLSAKEVG